MPINFEYSKFTNVSGIIVNQDSYETIPGVKINSPFGTTTTNKKGEFTIQIPEIEGYDTIPTEIKLEIIKKEYALYIIIPYTSEGYVKNNLGIISLNPLQSNLKKESTELSNINNSEIDKYLKKDITPGFYTQQKLNLGVQNLKSLVIPLILNLISKYGLTQIQSSQGDIIQELTDSIKEQIICPTQEGLLDIITTKNKLVKQINSIFNSIKNTTNALEISDGIIKAIDIAYQILKNLPVPTAIGGVGIPISVVNSVQDTKTILSNNISKLKQTNIGLVGILSVLESTLIQVLSLLNFLDLITQYCSTDTEANISQEQISIGLTSLTQQQSQQLSPTVTNINGFDMGVESEITEKPLKRRRAIARNKQGVVMLKGEWSFSSIDQILIDELVFYIQQNNLKAD